MTRIAYARVSSQSQSLDVQLEKLKDCDRVFKEKVSARTDKREQLQLALDYVREDDIFVVTRLDRLARSTRDLLNIVNTLENKKVKLQVIEQNIDTSTSTGKLMLSLLAVIAEFENDLRKERQSDGIALALQRGIKFGRQSSLTESQVNEMRTKRQYGTKIKDLMTEYQLSKASVYRLLQI